MNKIPSPKHTTQKTEVVKAAPPPAKAAPTPASAKTAVPTEDGKHGRELLSKVLARKVELSRVLAAMRAAAPSDDDEASRSNAIQKALAAVETLLTGNLDKIDDANATALTEWMQTSAVLSSKKAPPARHAAPAPAPMVKH